MFGTKACWSGSAETQRVQSCNQMVVRHEIQADLSESEVDRLFGALADATRRDILRRTLVGEPSVTELANQYDMSFAAVQKHVGVLERAGLVSKQQHGRERLVRGDPVRLERARELLDAYEVIWRARLAALDDVLDEQP
jgi:DNA-binding transcriptional ArsR family regulator